MAYTEETYMIWNRKWIAVVAVAGLAACGGGDAAEDDAAADSLTVAPAPTPEPVAAAVTFPDGVTQAMADAGKDVFNTGICVNCHMAGAIGGPLAPALNDTAWINIDGSYDAIVSTIKSGVASPKQHPTPMPPMGGGQFTDEQVNQLAAYVFSISRGT
jgi:mono/diheme cytochrome c family protein